MSSPYSAFANLPDDQLLAEITRLAARERQATAELVASLVVLDERRLYLREGYPSLFAYCTGALHLSEGAAYLRIEAARAVRRFPTILDRLASGAITLTGVKLLAPHLTEATHLAVLETARAKTTREIEQLVARLYPRPDVPAVVRKLPARHAAHEAPAAAAALASATASTPAAVASHRAPVSATAGVPSALAFDGLAAASPAVPPRPAVVAPLAPERYKVQMTISAETHDRLCRVRALLRDALPDGDPAAIFDRALVLLLERLERQKWAARKARGDSSDGDPANRAPGSTAARKDRGRPRRGADGSSARTAGATEPPGSGDPGGAGPAIRAGEQPAGPAAVADELVARRVCVADGQVVQLQRGTALSESKICPTVSGERPGCPGVGASELLAKRVRRGNGRAADARPGETRARPSTGRARRIPAAVRRAVWLRANGQCTYVSPGGQRCPARSRLEFHHVVPYADGGQANVDGITLLCAGHHARETERWFGERPRPRGHRGLP